METRSERVEQGGERPHDRYGEGGSAALVFVPALGTPARIYARFAATLAEQGVAVLVPELRGVGRSPLRAERDTDWGYADLVDGEVAAAITAARQQWPDRPLWLGGHSLGGHLALLHQARHPTQSVDGLLLVASGAPYWRSYAGSMAWITRGFGALVGMSTRLCGYFPGHRLGFGGRQAASLMLDWSAFLRSGEPQARGWSDSDWRTRLQQLTRPALAMHIPGDRYAPPAAIRHLLSLTAIRCEPEDAAYPDTPGHFGWLKQPAPVVERTVQTLQPASLAGAGG